MESQLDFYHIAAVIIRIVSLGILFLWGFYRAFVTDLLIRRILYALLTFTTILFMTLVADTPANMYRNFFFLNLAALKVYEFFLEAKTERFSDAFKTMRGMRKKLMDTIHHTERPREGLKGSPIKH